MKKFLIAVIAVSGGALLILCLTIIQPELLGLSANAWFTFHGDMARTGFSPDLSPSNNAIAWTYNLAQVGSQKGVILGSPAIASGKVIFGALDGKVHALDAKNGKELWTFKGQKSFGTSSPTVTGDKVIIGGQDKFVYALDLNSGKQIWRYLTDGMVNVSPVVLDDQVLVGSEGGYLYALDLKTGGRNWREKLGDKISSSPAIYKNRIYVNADTSTEDKFEIFCLNPKDGSEYWSYETDTNTKLTSLSLANNMVYSGGTDGKIYAIRANDGIVAWSKEAGDEFNDAPAYAYDRVYALSANGETVSLGKDDGHIFWRYKTGAPAEASPIIADKKICLGNQAGNFYCLDRAGALIWKKKLTGQVTAAATAANGLIVVVSHTDKDSVVTAFGKYIAQ